MAGKALNLLRLSQLAAHPERSGPAQRALHSIVAALVRPQELNLPLQVHAAAVAHAVQFTQAQVGVLPRHYRAAFVVALLALDRSALLQRVPTFAALPPVDQDRLLAAWSDTPLPQPRQFLRLVRSASLLGFFEYPAVACAVAREGAAP